ncbi:TonB-dependent receptor [Sphingomonas nostoxanthinifaciens]|uniref:TonB-dependent receptor n=1 Tax=Sphingomonas nostoxanthinifaciens TaxID=2872652 RepID=UPI001CC1E40E|nr:TonB-dependent receptor [Sphingomonas nostoxanthinifaciens]UAK25798.1 TonB-dependent receptor [Sphingomonas nostoxanthinifaciens]
MSRPQLLSAAGVIALASVLASAPAFAQDAPNTGEELVVTGTRLAKTARQEEKASTAIVDIQSAETIAKYPDVNAADALSRIPGVFLDTDQSEGRFVNIRGIDGNLNGATFGGAALLNTNPGSTIYNGTGRAVLFNTIPIGAIDRIVVTKSWLPEHDAEGVGGSVELTPRSAMTHSGFFVEGRVGGGYETQRGTGLINDEVAIGDSFGRNRDGDKLIHVVVAQSERNDKRGFDDIETTYADKPGILKGAQPEDKVANNIDFRRYRYERERYGYSFDLDVTPDSNNLFFIRGSDAGTRDLTSRQRLRYRNIDGTGKLDALGNRATGSITVDPSNPNGFVATDAALDNTLRDRKEYNRNIILQGGGKHNISDFTVDWLVSYVHAIFDNPYDRNSTFNGPRGVTIAYDNITDPSFPSVAVRGVNAADPSLYRLHDIQNTSEYSADREYSYHLNVSKPLHILADDQLKVGGELRYRQKYDVITTSTLTLADATTGLGNGPTLASLLGPGPVSNYYDGLANIGYAANASAIASQYAAQIATPPLNRHAPGALVFNDTENIASGYIQYSGDIGRLHLLTGVRVEHTKQILGGFTSAATVDPVSGAAIPANSYLTPTRSYTNAFPSVHLVYRFDNRFQLRASYSTSIARPGFYQTASRQTVDLANAVINTGNQDLRPTYSNNFDLGAYYYLPNSGVLSVGLYYKLMKDFVVARSFTQMRAISGVTENFNIVSYSNVSDTYDRGVEANYVQRFAALPAPFDGLGVDLNALYADTRVNLKSGMPAETIPGAANFSANAAIFYEAHGLNLRLAMNHNSKTLYTIGGSPTQYAYGAIAKDIFLAARTTLDATASYDLTNSIGIYWSVKNITNAPLYSYEGTYNRPIRREYYGQTYDAGIKFKF